MEGSKSGKMAQNSPGTANLAEALRSGSAGDQLLRDTAPEELHTALEEALNRIPSDGAVDRSDPLRATILHLLDAGRRPVFLCRIAGTPDAERWIRLVERAVDEVKITLGDLFRLRIAQDPEKVQIEAPGAVGGETSITRRRLGERVNALAAGLIDALPAGDHRVGLALFAPNRLETILVDLACLTHGIVNTPIAADATAEHVHLILEQTRPPILVVSDAKRYETVVTGGGLAYVQTVILIDRPDDAHLRDQVRLLDEIESTGQALAPAEPLPIGPDDVATIMFTSGTTGRPKGIRFGHRNIVFKRFCRAVALPEIGEDDTFLCYLPLFHTFGRYLEMTGTLFWGATYVLMENPSKEVMFRYMEQFRPSVFISIPKRWIQIYERFLELAEVEDQDIAKLDYAKLGKVTKNVTGGRLRWGLSAAGHLDADIFQFYHRLGIELMSGFGMTEATGGITMTPPGSYRRGTVGLPLPGIELMIAEDGELLCRGSYMLLGYDDEEEPRDFRKDWFATGDLFKTDPQGFYTIVDRKKDIYKNVKGQTIAPQKIENLFNEFEEIKRVFLVGDGRECNTLLIYPDYEVSEGKLARMSTTELREYLSSYVVSVNRFLAPFERIVDFDLLPRFFREDKGELTPKGTFIRKVVERNFAEQIESLYALAFVSVRVRGIHVRVPTWLLREKGVTAEGLIPESGGIRLRHSGERLAIERIGGVPGRYRIGSYIYRIMDEDGRNVTSPRVDLDPLLRVPKFWVGNAELARFAGESLMQRARRGEIPPGGLSVVRWLAPKLLTREIVERFEIATSKREAGPSGVHAVASLVFVGSEEQTLTALSILETFLEDPARDEAVLVHELLPLLRHHPLAAVRRRALSMLLPREVDERAADALKGFLEADPEVLSEEVEADLLQHAFGAETVESFLELARDLSAGREAPDAGDRHRVISLLRLIAGLGSRHPRWFAGARQVLVHRAITEHDEEIAEAARRQRERLEGSFREWIDAGPLEPSDQETGRSIDWEEIVAFDDRVDDSVRERLRKALRETTLLRTSIFMLWDGLLIGSEDLIPGGIWVSYLGAGHGKTVVRVTVRIRKGRTFEFVVKVMREIQPAEAAEEAAWMIRLGTRERKVRLVPEFGDFWSEYGLWSEEYIANETVLAYLKRMSSSDDPERMKRLFALWPHFAWSALATFVEFWQRSGRAVVLAEPVPFNIVVAPHDYQEGSRIVSVSSRSPFAGIARMIQFLYEGFVSSTEEAFPVLKGKVTRQIVFAAMVEALGEEIAIPLLWRALSEMRDQALLGAEDSDWSSWHDDLATYIEEVERDGFPPRRLVMAVRRYHTWTRLNPGASLQARALMLHELYETYAFHEIEDSHPEIRIRFFRMTAFANATGSLEKELDALIQSHRETPLSLEALLRRMTILHRSAELSEEDLYFLARMTYAHLRPAQKAHLELLEEGGETLAELVEETKDTEGSPLIIRAAANPKEVMRLHHLFEQSGLSVQFRPEHRFLIGVDEHGAVCGGLFYRPADRSTSHMEKIVVGPRHRRKGVGDRIMESFMERMRDEQRKKVTTGFFRPHYFYRFGFRLERGFAGLVRDLEQGGVVSREIAGVEEPAD